MPTSEHSEDLALAGEWIDQLGATEPGDLWRENLVKALTELGEPVISLLASHLTDPDRNVAMGVAEAVYRIAGELRRQQAARESSRQDVGFVAERYRFL